MKLSVVFVVVFALCLAGVRADLGLTVTIPSLSDYTTAGIAYGTDVLTATQKVAAVNAGADKAKVLPVIQQSLTDTISTLNTLFQVFTSAATDKLTPFATVFTNLNTAVTNAAKALGTVKTNVLALGAAVKASDLAAVGAAIDNMVTKVNALTPMLTQVNTGVTNANAAVPPVTVYTVGQYVTPGLIAAWSNTLNAITASTNTLAAVDQTIINTRNMAITSQSSVDQYLASSSLYLSGISTTLINTAEGVKSNLLLYSQTTLTLLNQAYTPVMSNILNWNKGVVTKLTTFLSGYATYINNDFTTGVATAVTNIETAVPKAMNDKNTKDTGIISGVAQYITDTASASPSVYAPGCSAKYIAQLIAPTNSLNRLAGCILLDMASVTSVATYGDNLLDLAKNDGAKTMSQLGLCNNRNLDCDSMLFTAFDNQAKRATSELTNALTVSSGNLGIISDRVVECINAVGMEIETTSNGIKTAFDNCLNTGN